MRLADTRASHPAVVTGVHGTSGTTAWQQLVPGHALVGPWEAVEIAAVPPGGVSGLHRHTRTVEIYFILAGTGEFMLDGAATLMPAGQIAVTAVGSVHGLRNMGSRELSWLVIEVPAPRAPIARRAEPYPEVVMSPSIGPIDLASVQQLNLREAGLAPFEGAGILSLAAGEVHEFAAENAEIFAFVLDGEIDLRAAGYAGVLGDSVGLTLPLGERARVAAVTPARVFWATATAAEQGL